MIEELPIVGSQPLKELVVLSGKGGTGKTSITASLATLCSDSALVDCDVDAADLHLIMQPTVLRREAFSGGKRARIDSQRCNDCGKCFELCRFGAVLKDNATTIDPIACEGCGVCAHFCTRQAIALEPVVNGEWFVSETRSGPMVHAQLGIAEENSGKLVSLIRREARLVAHEHGARTLIVDGSPGIGCPVIASITGADLALIVTEPTQSGLHDLDRVLQLSMHFNIPAVIAINKWDINPSVCETIEERAGRRGTPVVGRIRYDRRVTEAQMQGQAIVEYEKDGAAADVKNVCAEVVKHLATATADEGP